jgi:hypothetical protein
MTKAQEAAINRACGHENLLRELVEALQWAASALQSVSGASMPAHELDSIYRVDKSESRMICQILDAADAVLAKTKGQA